MGVSNRQKVLETGGPTLRIFHKLNLLGCERLSNACSTPCSGYKFLAYGRSRIYLQSTTKSGSTGEGFAPTKRGGYQLLHVLSLAVVLAVVWWLLSGYTLILILSLGAASIALTIAIAHRMDRVDHETHPLHKTVRVVTYFPWLVWEIVKANVDVVMAILKKDMTIEPRLLELKASQRSEIGRVTYANSITLTPGTVTLSVKGDDLIVHSLTAGAREGLQTGEMDRRVSDMELGKGGPSADDQPALQDDEPGESTGAGVGRSP